jgi:hypothetical protein
MSLFSCRYAAVRDPAICCGKFWPGLDMEGTLMTGQKLISAHTRAWCTLLDYQCQAITA